MTSSVRRRVVEFRLAHSLTCVGRRAEGRIIRRASTDGRAGSQRVGDHGRKVARAPADFSPICVVHAPAESRAPALVRSRRRGKNQADVAKVLDAPWRAQRVLPVIVSRAGRLSRPVDERESSCATRIVHDLRSEDQVWRYVSTALIRGAPISLAPLPTPLGTARTSWSKLSNFSVHPQHLTEQSLRSVRGLCGGRF